MTFRENAAVLETYLHNIRNIEEVPPGPMELEALDAAIEVMKAAVENVEDGAFAWDKQRGMFVQIGRPVPVKQLCLKRYQEKVRNGEIPSWIDPEKFKILERKRKDRSRPVSEMLLMMFRSAARDRKKVLSDGH